MTAPAALPFDQAPPLKEPLIWSATCACCEVTAFMLTPVIPDDWRTEKVGNATYAYCPDCAIDLPKGSAR